MRQPCNNCPFRSDRAFHGLRRGHAEEVVDGLLGDRAFHCHKTTRKVGLFKAVITDDSRPCVGGLIFMQKVRHNGAIENLWVRFGSELGEPGFDLSDLDPNAPVCASVEEFYQQAIAPEA